jgi:hypothetical protein
MQIKVNNIVDHLGNKLPRSHAKTTLPYVTAHVPPSCSLPLSHVVRHVDLAGNTLQHVPPCLRTLPSLNASAVCLHGNPLTDYRRCALYTHTSNTHIF